MSRRVEESESLSEHLKEMVKKLDNTNTNPKKRNDKLEDIILFFMKEREGFKNIEEIDENLRGEGFSGNIRKYDI